MPANQAQEKQEGSPGLLASAFQGFSQCWIEWVGLWSFSWLRPRNAESICVAAALRHRDYFVIGASVLSLIAFCRWDPELCTWGRALLLGLALYRVFDLLVSLLHLGLLGAIHDDVPLDRLPASRLRRALSCVLLNYFELLFWFALVYIQIDHIDSGQFNRPIHCHRQACFVSMSTMTTVGYGGYAPEGGLALAAATVQAFMVLVVVVIVISRIVTLSKARTADKQECTRIRITSGCQRYICWVMPWLVVLVFWFLAYVTLRCAEA